MTTSGGSLADPAFHDITLRPRRARRHVTALVVFLLLAATLRTGYVAWRDQSWTIAIVAGALFVLALVVWTAWVTSPIAVLRVQGGVLHVTRAGRTDHFNLASPYTGVAVAGKPGRPDWEVRFARADKTPFVVDSSIVDAKAFMRVLEAYRNPSLTPEQAVPLPRQEAPPAAPPTAVESLPAAPAPVVAPESPRSVVVEEAPAAAPVEASVEPAALADVALLEDEADDADDDEAPAPRSHRARVSRLTVVTNRALRRR